MVIVQTYRNGKAYNARAFDEAYLANVWARFMERAGYSTETREA